MHVSIEQIKIGVSAFVEHEVASKAVGFQKFATYFVLPKINKAVEGYLHQFKDNYMTADFYNESGNVNVDEMYNLAKQAVQKSGQFTLYGVILGESDIDKLYHYIQRATA
jgi:hypothetical protein